MLEVVILKDSPDSDLVGIAKVNLQQLANDNVIDSVQDIYNGNSKVGAVHLKCYWY